MAQPPSLKGVNAEDVVIADQQQGLTTFLDTLNPFIRATTDSLNKGLTLNDNLNAIEKEFVFTAPPYTWKSVTFANNWANAASTPTSSTGETAGYRIDEDGMVHLKGLIYNTTTGPFGAGSLSHAFVLDSGYRPAKERWFAAASPGTTIAGWTAIGAGDFTNSWTNYGGSAAVAAYYRDPYGRVHLKGSIKNGTANTSAFTLPTGYRPEAELRFCTLGNGVVAVATTVDTSGYVKCFTSDNAEHSLDGVSFRTSTTTTQDRQGCPLAVQADGKVLPYEGNATYISLDGVSFAAANPAFPPVFVGKDWPLIVESGQDGPIQAVQIVSIQPVERGSDKGHGGAALQWEPGPGGNIIIRRASRLTPEKQYKCKILMFPRH